MDLEFFLYKIAAPYDTLRVGTWMPYLFDKPFSLQIVMILTFQLLAIDI